MAQKESWSFIIPTKSAKTLWIVVSVIVLCTMYIWFRFGYDSQSISSTLYWENDRVGSNGGKNSSLNNNDLGSKRQNSGKTYVRQNLDLIVLVFSRISTLHKPCIVALLPDYALSVYFTNTIIFSGAQLVPSIVASSCIN